MLFLAAAAVLFWDQGPETANALKDAGIAEIRVPAARLAAWKSAGGIKVETGEIEGATKLLAPTVNYRTNQATASREPWLDSNGWRFIRQPNGRFYYDVAGPVAAIAAAEAAIYGGSPLIKTDAAGLKPLGEMLKFLGETGGKDLAPIADFAFLDDGTPAAGEVINLLARGNLQFKLATAPDSKLKMNVKLGAKEYPAEDAKNPKVIAQMVRTNLTDEKRSLRVYGSPVVLGRVMTTKTGVRVHLLNYAGTARKVDGLRVRVLGKFPKHAIVSADPKGLDIVDFNVDSSATEFSLRELATYTIIDLSR